MEDFMRLQNILDTFWDLPFSCVLQYVCTCLIFPFWICWILQTVEIHGICPSFHRGPRGVWTRKLKGETVSDDLELKRSLQPSSAHMAIARLHCSGLIKFVATTNVDDLHCKSGLPKESLAELHGNSFVEECEKCLKQYKQSFVTRTATGLFEHHTGRYPSKNHRVFFVSQFDPHKGELGIFGKVDFCNYHPTMSEILSSELWSWFRFWFAWTSFDPACIHNSILMKGIVSVVDLCAISLWILEIPLNTFLQWKISMMLHGFIVWLLRATISPFKPGWGLQTGEHRVYVFAFASCFAAAWV